MRVFILAFIVETLSQSKTVSRNVKVLWDWGQPWPNKQERQSYEVLFNTKRMMWHLNYANVWMQKSIQMYLFDLFTCTRNCRNAIPKTYKNFTNLFKILLCKGRIIIILNWDVRSIFCTLKWKFNTPIQQIIIHS